MYWFKSILYIYINDNYMNLEILQLMEAFLQRNQSSICNHGVFKSIQIITALLRNLRCLKKKKYNDKSVSIAIITVSHKCVYSTFNK